MKIFASTKYYHQFLLLLREAGDDISIGSSERRRYPNGEMYAYIRDEVEGEHCMVVGTIAPPDEQLVALLLLIEALNRNGAISVTVFLPYLAYARQDKAQDGESGGIAFVSTLLRVSGADRIITIDIHSERDRRLMDVPVRSLSAAPLFAAAIMKLGWAKPTIVAPDEGALLRAQMLTSVFGRSFQRAHLIKRHDNSVIHRAVVGSVDEDVVIVDDILDSGRTLMSACETLRQNGVRRIAAVITHGLFTNQDWVGLFDRGLEALFVTDTCPEAVQQFHPKVRLVSIAPLFPEVVAAKQAGEV